MLKNDVDEAAANDRFARALRGRGAVSLLATVVILLAGNLIGAALVFLWAWRSGTPLGQLGFRPARNWSLTLALGTLGGVLNWKCPVRPADIKCFLARQRFRRRLRATPHDAVLDRRARGLVDQLTVKSCEV